MAEILQNAFQKAIDEQGEMEIKKSQKAPTEDSVIGTGWDIIQPPKTEVKEVVSDEGADDQEASATEAKVPEFEQRMSPGSGSSNDSIRAKSPVNGKIITPPTSMPTISSVTSRKNTI
jgi:hypothetical protein